MMVLCGFGCIQDWFLSSYSACVVPILVHFCKSYYAQQKNVTLCFLNFVFLFSGSIFWGDVLQQNRQWASAQVSTPQNARGWDCQYSAPIVPAIVHSLFVIASALVWSAKCYVVQRCSCYDNEKQFAVCWNFAKFGTGMKNATELDAMHLQLAAEEQWQNIILGKNDGGKVGLSWWGVKPTQIKIL